MHCACKATIRFVEACLFFFFKAILLVTCLWVAFTVSYCFCFAVFFQILNFVIFSCSTRLSTLLCCTGFFSFFFEISFPQFWNYMCMLCIFRNSFASRSSVACTVVEKMLRSIENLPQPMQVKFLIFLRKEGAVGWLPLNYLGVGLSSACIFGVVAK